MFVDLLETGCGFAAAVAGAAVLAGAGRDPEAEIRGKADVGVPDAGVVGG